MYLALNRCKAVDVFANRMTDGQIHYGLIFTLPETVAESSVLRCSDLDTRSRHGQVGDWWLDAGAPGLSPGQTVLLIPRTWLIRQGFLPWRVLFMPHRAFALRNVAALSRHVWLEWSGPAADEDNEHLKDNVEDRFAQAKAA